MRKLNKRGFTLVELMIVVAIIGVLAALAIYGVRKYLTSAKTSEAKNTIGAITRGAVSAYEREQFAAQLLSGGGTSAAATHRLCDGTVAVPAAPPAGKKYQPKTAPNQDFNTGNGTVGWTCLKFTLSEPTYFQYSYLGQAVGTTTNGCTAAAPTGAGNSDSLWQSQASGDLTADGTFSCFISYGGIENQHAKVATTIFELNPDE